MEWAKRVEAVTNGRVKITIYPAETLFKVKEAIVATTSGLTDIAWVVIGQFPGRFPLSEAGSLPFLFNLPSGVVNGKTLGAAEINSQMVQELYDASPDIQKEWNEVKLMYMHTAAPSSIWATKSIATLADLKGLKIRVAAGPDLDTFQLLGTAPISMALPGCL